MKVSKIQIKDFKGFKDLTINLGENPARIIALVGPNGCGKSSVFDALLTKQSIIRNNSDTIGKLEFIHNTQPKKFFSKLDFFNIRQSIQLFLKIDNDQTISMDDLYIQTINTKQYHFKSLFSFRSPYRYNTDLKVKEVKSNIAIEENSYGASASIFIDRRIEENYRHLLAYYNKYRDDKDLRPSEAKARVIGKLNHSIQACLNLKISSLGDIENNRGTLFFTKTNSTEEIEFDCLSAGEKEVVDLLLDLFLRTKKYKDSIFLFDEPELHINTAIQRKLLQEINRLVGENGQIWIATHSIGFLRALQDDFFDCSQVIQFSEGLNLFTASVTLEPIERTHHKWMKIFQTALDDLSGLVAPKRIIYCEGRAEPKSNGEERGMDAKVFNNIFNAHHSETLFISSGGNTELDQRSAIAIAILNKALPDVEIWIFKDRDIGSGKNVTEEDRKENLNLQDNIYRIMKRWEIENYLFDKEVLIAYCQKNNKEFNEEKYLTVMNGKNIYNDDLKSLSSIFAKICNISTSINSDKFKEALSKYITPEMKVYKELEECIFLRK